LHGIGANGKSTLIEVTRALLGEYAQRTPTQTLLARRDSTIPNDIARLRGARFVTAAETEEGRRLAEGLVKDLTGGDTIAARFLHAEGSIFDRSSSCGSRPITSP
jgi:putative DNA primase/helicase